MNKMQLSKDMDNEESNFPVNIDKNIDTKKLFGFNSPMEVLALPKNSVCA